MDGGRLAIFPAIHVSIDGLISAATSL